MPKVINADNVEYEKVAWGLTKEIVAPKNMGSQKIKVKITEYLPGYAHRPHVHPHQEEVIFVVSGRGVTETEGGKKEIGPGSVVFVAPGEPHGTYNLSDSEPLKAIIIKAPPEDEEIRIP
jgi:mannose-6-phosphate isomerase-like protein (cupin superfamily)